MRTTCSFTWPSCWAFPWRRCAADSSAAAAWKAAAGARRLAGEAGTHDAQRPRDGRDRGAAQHVRVPALVPVFPVPTAWAWGFALGAGTLAPDAARWQPSPGPAAGGKGPNEPNWRRPREAGESSASRWSWPAFRPGRITSTSPPSIFRARAPRRSGARAPRRSEPVVLPPCGDHRRVEHPTGRPRRSPRSSTPRTTSSTRASCTSGRTPSAQRGEIEKARYVRRSACASSTARARAVLRPGDDPAVAQKPFQCTPRRRA